MVNKEVDTVYNKEFISCADAEMSNVSWVYEVKI